MNEFMNEQKDKLLINLVEPGRIGRSPFNKEKFISQFSLRMGIVIEFPLLTGLAALMESIKRQLWMKWKTFGRKFGMKRSNWRWLVTRPGCFLPFLSSTAIHSSINQSKDICFIDLMNWNCFVDWKEKRRAAQSTHQTNQSTHQSKSKKFDLIVVDWMFDCCWLKKLKDYYNSKLII